MKTYTPSFFLACSAATIFILLIAWGLVPALAQASNARHTSQTKTHTLSMNSTIQMTVGTSTFTIQLADNETAKSFKGMLPLTIQMNEINGNEKYYNLPKNLPSSSASRGTVHAGDLMLWGSDCLVLFYKDVSSSYSYTKIGNISDPSSLAAALGRGNPSISFELTK